MRNMNVIRSHKHDVYTEEVNKIALSANDDKRVILKDGVHTKVHGYGNGFYLIILRGCWATMKRKNPL